MIFFPVPTTKCSHHFQLVPKAWAASIILATITRPKEFDQENLVNL
uniref:Uncharacterized protein n=1 Tax=Arundo donax TaxID=35708 RepID=A0A0A8XR02_ARUDO